MSNIFLSRALQSAGTPIVNALGYRAAEQRQFTQMRNALLAEQQAQEAREQNALAELANLNVAAQGLPEATNQLNALIAGSATGQVNPNDVGKAAAQIAKINQELPQMANALMAEIQDAREKKAYLENDPFTRGIMSGDIKTMNALSGASLVKYPVREQPKYKFESFRVGDKDILARTTETGEFYVIDEGMRATDQNTFGPSDRLSVARLQRDALNYAYDRAKEGAYRIFPKNMPAEDINTLIMATAGIEDKDKRMEYITDYLKERLDVDDKTLRLTALKFDAYIGTAVPKHLIQYIDNAGGEHRVLLEPLRPIAEQKIKASEDGERNVLWEVAAGKFLKTIFTEVGTEDTTDKQIETPAQSRSGSSKSNRIIGG